MTVYTFDGTWEGLLTAVFEAFDRREAVGDLLDPGGELPLFGEALHAVATDATRAQRVWAGLERRMSKGGLRLFFACWLSERAEVHGPMFRYACKVFGPKGQEVERDFADPDVLAVTNMARRVLYERHRIMQFARFQKAKDGTYLAVVAPDHNVLLLAADHFRDRFRAQPWLLYDARRRYGCYFAGQGEVQRVEFAEADGLAFNLADGRLDEAVLSADDHLLQELWRTYFKAICIRERINPRKQLSDMPRRYWRYLVEKQPPLPASPASPPKTSQP